ncbi:MAG: carbohydrate-binding family 9-like protein [Armatimonadetes bacterium]|nr:carbohydrate-binding family 9-like protein [Armatimonadota bacterium]
MRQWAACLLLLLAFAALGYADAARPEYPCYRPCIAPRVDGEVADDPAWKNIPAVTGFYVLGGGYAKAKQTTAQACWDDQAFYVAMTCEEPDVPNLRLTVRDGGNFWEDDGVEIFIQPGEGKQVFQFGVTARGAKGGFEGFPDISKLRAGATMGDGWYSIELRVPHEVLRAKPRQGDRWLGNFCRNIFTTMSGGDKFTSWAPLKTRFLEPENFAFFKLCGPAPSQEEADKLSAQLNENYRATLITALAAAAQKAKEHIPVLGEAADHPTFGPQARELRRRWWRLVRLARRAEQASVWELRQAVTTSEALLDQSHKLKYDYLIAKLLEE